LEVSKIKRDTKAETSYAIHVNDQLEAQFFFCIRLFQISTCFEHLCSKHVEIWNKHTRKKKCVSSWSFTRIILRYMVNRT